MGLISRKIFPACESMCVCCPALRSRSRQPVKRYKKLLAEIFPKSLDGAPNERKIVKMCEYAAKNPFRIPKIAKFLEERCYKELRSEQIKFINIVTEAYNKMLFVCKEQMAYFALSLLNVVTELLDNSKQDATRILGCQTLTRFIYSQVDGTYTHNIETFLEKVCKLAHDEGEGHKKRCLRASSVQCLAAMVWFMGEFSYIFAAFNEVVHVTLDNYEPDMNNQINEESEEQHHNWVNEVIRCEGRGTIVGAGDTSPSYMIIRPRTQRKDPSLLTKEETETPKVWAQLCLQRMVDLAKESTTLRRVLDPMFSYFDSKRQWVPPNGLAMIVLSDMTYLMESFGNQQLVLSAVVRHLDNKYICQDPEFKSFIVQVAAALARQIRTGMVLREIGSVSDLCRHLRKSFQATAELVGEQELSSNVALQNSIEDCLLEIAKGIGDARPLFDMMALTLEKLPSTGVISRAAIGSLLILAHVISSVSSSSRSQQVFPEALLIQLLKAMLHPNVETRVGAHQIFSVLLMWNSNQSRSGVASVRSSGYLHEPRKWRSDTTSAFASITALLEKLRREKDGVKIEKNGYNLHDDFKSCKNSPSLYKLSSIIDRTAGPINLADMEPFILKFSEDQIVQLLSAFWIQSTLADNIPSNIEAIAHSLSLTLLSLRLKSPNDNLVIRVFQLLLSLRNISLDPDNGMLPPVCRRSILVLSTGMLMFASKLYHIPYVCDMLKSLVLDDVDPYLAISNDMQVYVIPQANMKEFGSLTDNQMATSLLSESRNKVQESENIIMEILVKNLSTITKLEEDDVQQQLSELFTPDDAFIFPRSVLELDHNQTHSKESLSSDEDVPINSIIEDDATSELSVAHVPHFFPKMAPSPSVPRIISIGQLMESALEVAGQVVGSSVSTSPLPYDTMANHCETFGSGTRKKLSNWLANENLQTDGVDKVSLDERSTFKKITEDEKMSVRGSMLPQDPWLAMRLPPASPFDNFLKAAGC